MEIKEDLAMHCERFGDAGAIPVAWHTDSKHLPVHGDVARKGKVGVQR